jgi:hypothetical protein
MPGGEENSTADTSILMNEIEKYAVITKVGVAFGSHFSKGDQSKKIFHRPHFWERSVLHAILIPF